MRVKSLKNIILFSDHMAADGAAKQLRTKIRICTSYVSY